MYVALGLRPLVVANVHADDVPAFAAALPGAVLRLGPSPQTTTFENRYDARGHRSQRVHGTAAHIGFDPTAVADADWVHLGPLLPEDLASDWFHCGCPVALDAQGLCRAVTGSGRVVARPYPLPAVDVLKCSRAEWALQGAPIAAETCVTDGAAGGEVRFAGRRATWRAEPLAAVAAPTGAGDLFFAAYLTARFAAAEPPDRAARFAARATGDWLQRNAR